jgi:uncharacterized protein with FMN-binding domain
MKKSLVLLTAVVFVLIAAGHAPASKKGNPPGKPFEVSYEDGTYRGIYGEAEIQVAVEFTLVNNVVIDEPNFRITFRRLFYGGKDYRPANAEDHIKGLREQHQALLGYLVGLDIRDVLEHLYEPGKIVQFDVDKPQTAVGEQPNPRGTPDIDVYTGATLRSGKVISAIRDGLNRGVYRY